MTFEDYIRLRWVWYWPWHGGMVIDDFGNVAEVQHHNRHTTAIRFVNGYWYGSGHEE
jgi:hypothetical protein